MSTHGAHKLVCGCIILSGYKQSPRSHGGTTGGPALRSPKETENTHIDPLLDATYGNKQHAAEILGINVATLYRKLKRQGERFFGIIL